MDEHDSKIDVQEQASCDCEASLFYKKYKKQIDRLFKEKLIEGVQTEKAEKAIRRKPSRENLWSSPSSESFEGIDTLRSDRFRYKHTDISKEDFGQFISPSVIDQELSKASREKRDEYLKRVQEKEKSRAKKKIGYHTVLPPEAKKGKVQIPDWVLNYQQSIMNIMEDESAKQMLSEPIITSQKSNQELFASNSDHHSIIKGKKKFFSITHQKTLLREDNDDEFGVKLFEDFPDNDPLNFKQDHEKIQAEIHKQLEKETQEFALTAEEKLKLIEDITKKKLPIGKELDFEKPQAIKSTEKDGVALDEQDSRKTGDSQDFREPRDIHDAPKTHDTRKDASDAHDIRDASDIRDARDVRDVRDARDPRDVRDARDARDPRDVHVAREPRDVRDARDPRDVRDAREPHGPQTHIQKSKETIISKSKEPTTGKEIVKAVSDDKEHRDKDVINLDERLPSEISKVDRKTPAKTSRGKMDAKKTRATKSKDIDGKVKIIAGVTDKESTLVNIEGQSAKEMAPKDSKQVKPSELGVPLIVLTPPTPKPKKDGVQITSSKSSQPAKPEIHTILKPRPIKSDDGSVVFSQEKQKDLVPMVKIDQKSQHRTVKYTEQALSKKISSTVSKPLTESLSSEKASTSESSKFKRLLSDEETQRQMKDTRQRLRELELAGEEEEDVGLGLDNLSKFDLGSQVSYDTKVSLAKKKTTGEQLEELKITTNTHYLKYLQAHKVDELFQFLGSHLVASAPENPVFFLISLLDSCLKYRSHLGAPPLLFQANHVESLYNCMDHMKEGFITIDQYHTGMKTMNIDYYNWNPELDDHGKVSKDTFINEAVAQQKIYLNDLIKPHDIGMSRPRMSDVM